MSVYLYEEDKIQIKLYYYFLRADGKISDTEREWFERVTYKNDNDMNVAQNNYVEIFIQKKNDVNEVVQECEDKMKGIAEGDVVSVMALIAHLLSGVISETSSYIGKVIWNLIDYGGCDGEFSDEEKTVIKFLIDFLGIDKESVDRLYQLHSQKQALEESKDALKKDRSKTYDEITEALEKVDEEVEECDDQVEELMEEIAESDIDIDDCTEFESSYFDDTEKNNKLKLFYSFIMADGEKSDSEINKFKSIAEAMELETEDAEQFRIEYGEYYDSFLTDDDFCWRSLILSARALAMIEEYSGISLRGRETNAAGTAWTLVNLAYADEDFSKSEAIILQFCKTFLNVDNVLFSEMTDTAETMLMLEKKKDWFKQSGLSYDEVTAQLNIINSQIESLASDIEFSVSEADIA